MPKRERDFPPDVTILCVDDDAEIVKALTMALTDEFPDAHVLAFDDPHRALEAASTTPIDLALSDVTMPGMDGYAFGTELRQLQPGVGLIFVTALSSVGDRVRGLRDAEADDYVTKPFDVDELYARIRSVLRRKFVVFDEAGRTRLRGKYVFISYARDDMDYVNRLEADLQQHSITHWIDHDQLEPGTLDWERAIRQGIKAAKAVMLVASPSSADSGFVRDELRVASAAKVPIIPIWVAGADWISSIPLGFGSMQYCDARGKRYAAAIRRLIDTLARL